MTKYDVVVIGSGPGGYVAAIRAAQLGLKTACVEKDALGGTCLNVGCIPSKTLLHSTEYLAWMQHASEAEGINCTGITIDFPKMMERKSQVVGSLVKGIAGLFKQRSVTHIKGTARFASPRSIEVTNNSQKEIIEAQHFILATGSEPIALPFLPFDESSVLSSTGILNLTAIPKSLLVIGGGVIGVELGSVYNRLGTQVTVVEMLERICIPMDAAVSAELLKVLKKQGLTFYLGSKVIKADRGSQSITITIQQEKQEQQLTAEKVLVAVGRRPYLAGLGLQEIGIKMEKGFVAVDSNFRTSVATIYAIGDIIEGPMLAHRASEEGNAVAEIIAGQNPHVNYMALPNVIYTHPEVAAVGMTEQEARMTGKDIVIGTVSFRGIPRARCNNDMEGFVKVIGLGSERYLVGMHIIGPQAAELINIGMVAIERKATLTQLAHASFAHPTLSEAIKEACGMALGIAIHG